MLAIDPAAFPRTDGRALFLWVTAERVHLPPGILQGASANDLGGEVVYCLAENLKIY